MRALAPPTVVAAPAVAPPLHSLVASALKATEADSRWELGFTFAPEDCFTTSVWSPHCASPPPTPDVPGGGVAKSAAEDNPDLVTFLPFIMESPFECSSAGFQSQDYTGRARRQVEAGTPNALEAEFWTGALMEDNAALVQTPNTIVVPGVSRGILNLGVVGAPTALSPTRALARLIDGMAKAGPGGRGMIHATPELVTLWTAADLLKEDGPRLVTKVRGNVVVAGGGYPGTGPTGSAVATPAAGQTWAYGTGMVQVRLGDIEVVPATMAEALNRLTNTVTYRGERAAAASWSGCTSLAVLVDMTIT